MIRVISIEPPSNMPISFADSDGRFSFDLSPDTSLVMSLLIDNYISPGEIKQDSFDNIEFPITYKNRLLLQGIGNPNTRNPRNSKIFSIEIHEDANVIPLQGFTVREIVDTKKKQAYVCELFGQVNLWFKPLKDLKLNQLQLGSALLFATYFQSLTRQPASIRQDNGEPVFVPVANYGKWHVPYNRLDNRAAKAQIVMNDLRPWHSPKALLEQAFCQVGYKLIAPAMDTEEFRRIWCYLLDPNFETVNYDATRPRAVEVVFERKEFFNPFAGGTNYQGIVPFFANEVTSDLGNHIINYYIPTPSQDRIFGSFLNAGFLGMVKFEGSITIDLANVAAIEVNPPEYFGIKVSLRKAPKFGQEDQDEFIDRSQVLSEYSFLKKDTIPSNWQVTLPVNLSSQLQKFYRHEFLFLYLEFETNLTQGGQSIGRNQVWSDVYFDQGCRFYNTIEKQVLSYDDTVEWGALLDQNLTAVDLLVGIAHTQGWKLESKESNKTVSFYPEFPVDLPISGIQEAYFKSNGDALDITNRVEQKSLQITNETTELGRTVLLQFKPTTDGYIINKEYEYELHGKEIDMGDKFRAGENLIENPLFEPTDTGVEEQTSGIVIDDPGATLDGTQAVNYMPLIWESAPSDTEYPDRAFNIQPRIAIAHPSLLGVRLSSELSGRTNARRTTYVFEDNRDIISVPFGQIFEPDVVNLIDSTGTVAPFNLSIVYGNRENPSIKDQYAYIYDRMIQQAYSGITLNALVRMSNIDFNKLSFRDKRYFTYEHTAYGLLYIHARLSEIIDYKAGVDLTPIEMVPDSNFLPEDCA